MTLITFIARRCHFPRASIVEVPKWRQQDAQISRWGERLAQTGTQVKKVCQIHSCLCISLAPAPQSLTKLVGGSESSQSLTKLVIFVIVSLPCEKNSSAVVFKAVTYLDFLESVLGRAPSSSRCRHELAVGAASPGPGTAEGSWPHADELTCDPLT